ncbi:hypothetical protein Syun_017327 [Stephania yunnanensis]|uniref:Uncharacterized protein n=1 Tax=Stephania yunnanensis TaxID=152371 RepID=A0AAP0P4Y6_9MAGN
MAVAVGPAAALRGGGPCRQQSASPAGSAMSSGSCGQWRSCAERERTDEWTAGLRRRPACEARQGSAGSDAGEGPTIGSGGAGEAATR